MDLPPNVLDSKDRIHDKRRRFNGSGKNKETAVNNQNDTVKICGIQN